MKRVLVWLVLLGGCRRERLVFPVQPKLEFVSLSPKQLPEQSLLKIVLRYQDGDGDLGGQPDGRPDLFLIDQRDSSLFPQGYDGILRYNMPLFYQGSPQSIQGTIEISISGLIRLDPSKQVEPIWFEVYLRDRAGHESNHVRTDTAYIVP